MVLEVLGLAMALEVLEVVWLELEWVCHRGTWVAPDELERSCQHLDVLGLAMALEVLEVVWLELALVCHLRTWVAPDELSHLDVLLQQLEVAPESDVLLEHLDVLSHLEVLLQQLDVAPQPDVLLEHLLVLHGSLEDAGTIADVALPRLSANCRGW